MQNYREMPDVLLVTNKINGKNRPTLYKTDIIGIADISQ